tara:strand:- start:3478 stop:3666 length:189 start_codon:yes stop_codon:yes gene_type:complete
MTIDLIISSIISCAGIFLGIFLYDFMNEKPVFVSKKQKKKEINYDIQKKQLKIHQDVLSKND